jgi:acetyl esterase/lipase
MRLWDDEVEAARDKIRTEAAEFVARFPAGPPADQRTGSDLDHIQARREAESALVIRSEKAVDRMIAGPAGALRLREFRPPSGTAGAGAGAPAAAAMLHIHGGGWTAGTPELTDLLNESLSERLNLAIVSVDYRLAPEHPYPAAPDDCEAAALWLIEHATGEYGTDRLLIGGESAGAHLSAVTLLRLRDRHRAAGRFCGANLVFGAYDLTFPPSAKGIGLAPGTDILNPEDMQFVVSLFAAGLSEEQRSDPDLSPLYADLHGMPPALFTVGTADHLVDDTLFFANRWAVAGSHADLLVYPDAPHGCIGLPTVMNHWWPRLEAFLGRAISS